MAHRSKPLPLSGSVGLVQARNQIRRIGCAQAADYQAAFTISDADGNQSDPYVAPAVKASAA